MKKLIIILSILTLLYTPLFVHAQVVNQEEVKQELIQVLTQLISQLEQQIQQILLQQQTIIQNTTPEISTYCLPAWSCSDWSNCDNGFKTRSCTDLEQCGKTDYEPSLYQDCYVPTPTPIPTPTPTDIPMCARVVPSTCRYITNY